MERYLIAGNGVAGTTAALNIRKIDPAGHITIITEEAYPFYSRIRLIEYLAGEADENSIVIYKDDWYEKNNIKLILNTVVASIDTAKKEASLSSGEKLKYGRLLIATGARSFVPPIKGSDLKGVFTLRNIKDAAAIKSYAETPKEIILIGGGVLGLETGNALRKKGHRIKVIESFDRLLPRQMDPEGAKLLKSRMEEMGFEFYLGAKTKEILDEGALLEDGRLIGGDMSIISAGVRADTALASASGINTNRGVMVDDRMCTSEPDIFSAGDCAEHKGVSYGIWPAAEAQGKVAGINMAGGNASYEGTTLSNILKVAGIELFSAGNIDAEGRCRCILQTDRGRHIYRKLVIEDNCISGCILYGSTEGRAKILRAMGERKNIASIIGELEKWNLEHL